MARWATGSKGTAAETRTNRSGFVVIPRSDQSLQDLVCGLHSHATEVGYEMSTLGMASNATFYNKSSVSDRSAGLRVEIPVHRLAFLRPKGSK